MIPQYNKQAREIEAALNGQGTLIQFGVADYDSARAELVLTDDMFLIRGHVRINGRKLLVETHLTKVWLNPDSTLNWVEYVVDMAAEAIKAKLVYPNE